MPSLSSDAHYRLSEDLQHQQARKHELACPSQPRTRTRPQHKLDWTGLNWAPSSSPLLLDTFWRCRTRKSKISTECWNRIPKTSISVLLASGLCMSLSPLSLCLSLLFSLRIKRGRFSSIPFLFLLPQISTTLLAVIARSCCPLSHQHRLRAGPS